MILAKLSCVVCGAVAVRTYAFEVQISKRPQFVAGNREIIYIWRWIGNFVTIGAAFMSDTGRFETHHISSLVLRG